MTLQVLGGGRWGHRQWCGAGRDCPARFEGMSAVFEEKLLWLGGHPLSTHGPTVKDHDGHLSTLVSTGNACPGPTHMSPAAESKPWAAVSSCSTQHRASPKIPRAFEEGNLASDQNKGGRVFLPVSILERRECGELSSVSYLCFRTRESSRREGTLTPLPEPDILPLASGVHPTAGGVRGWWQEGAITALLLFCVWRQRWGPTYLGACVAPGSHHAKLLKSSLGSG